MIFSEKNTLKTLFVSAFILAGAAALGSCGGEKPADDAAKSENAAPVAGADADKGKDLYIQNGCAGCHGETGLGDGVAGQALNPKPRNLAQASSYKQGSGIDEIAATIGTGIPGTAMIAYPHIPEGDRKLIAAYIKSLQQ